MSGRMVLRLVNHVCSNSRRSKGTTLWPRKRMRLQCALSHIRRHLPQHLAKAVQQAILAWTRSRSSIARTMLQDTWWRLQSHSMGLHHWMWVCGGQRQLRGGLGLRGARTVRGKKVPHPSRPAARSELRMGSMLAVKLGAHSLLIGHLRPSCPGCPRRWVGDLGPGIGSRGSGAREGQDLAAAVFVNQSSP